MDAKILKSPHIEKKNIRKILIIKLRGLGDVLLSTPVIKNLRDYFPNSQIDYLTEPESFEILNGNPDLNRIILFGRFQKGVVKFIYTLHKEKYDLVIDLFGNPRSAIFTLLSGAKYRMGFKFGMRKIAYNFLLEPQGQIVHNVDFNLDVIRALRIPVNYGKPYLFISEKEERFADLFLKDKTSGSFFFGINPGAGWETRIWGYSKFAELSDMLIENHNACVIIFWGPGQEYMYERIRDLMKYKPIIAPPTSLKEMAALYKKCKFVVSNNNGPMHIAAACGTPTLGIFGSTIPEFQGPVGNNCTTIQKEGLDCLGCNLLKCNIGTICMAELSTGEVYKKILEWQKI